MNKPKAFFVVSNYNNDISWIKDYTGDYIIYDKSNTLEESEKVLKVENVGYNIYDISHYIINNYHNLPDYVAFLEGNPFDHCKKETFDKIIYNEKFTPIEDYSDVPESYAHTKDMDGGYMEINNSWYIQSHVQTYGEEVIRYIKNYNDFLLSMFENPYIPNYIRFSPGGQYIVPRINMLYYSLDFWKKIQLLVSHHRIPSEGHVIERALYYIFTNTWKERKEEKWL